MEQVVTLLPRQRHHNVVEHGHAREELQVLEGARHSAAYDLMRPEPLDRRAAQSHVAIVRLEESGEQVEGGGLAGAVGADQTDDPAAPQLDFEAGDGEDAAEAAREPFARDRDGAIGRRGCGERQGATRRRCRRPAARRDLAEQPLRTQQENGDEHQAVDHLPTLVGDVGRQVDKFEQLRQGREQHRAQHRAPQIAGAADDHHGEDVDGEIEGKGPGADETDVMRVEPARYRGESRRKRRTL